MNFAKFFGPLSNLQFDKLLIADVLTTFCDVIMQFLLIAWILDFAKNPATPIVGVFISFVAAFLIVSPFCGFFADKYQKNRLLSASCFYRTFLALIIAGLAFAAGQEQMDIYPLYVLSFLVGVGSSIFYCTKMAFVPEFVETNQLKYTNTIFVLTIPFAIVFSGFITNFSIKNAGQPNSFWIFAIVYAIAGLVAFFVKSSDKIQKEAETDTAFLPDVWSVFKYFNTHRHSLYMVFFALIISIFSSALLYALISLIMDYYFVVTNQFSLIRLYVCAGILIGCLLLFIAARFVKSVYFFIAAVCVILPALFSITFCNSYKSSWMWLVPAGIALTVVVVYSNTFLQRAVPKAIKGKVFALQSALFSLIFAADTLLPLSWARHLPAMPAVKLICILNFIIMVLITAGYVMTKDE